MANDANGDDVEILPKQMLRPNPGKFEEIMRKNGEWGRRGSQSRRCTEANICESNAFMVPFMVPNINQRPERTL